MDAGSIPPTFPFHIARAYGASATAPTAPATRPGPAARPAPATETIRPSGDSVQLSGTPNVDRLVAARVQHQAEFAPSAAGTAPGALPLYRHPADRNAAATGVRAGSLLDLQG